MSEYLGIKLDYGRNEYLSAQAQSLVKDYYCLEGEDPQ